jgi:hypothetical protein
VSPETTQSVASSSDYYYYYYYYHYYYYYIIAVEIIMAQRTEPIHTEGEYVTKGSAPCG